MPTSSRRMDADYWHERTGEARNQASEIRNPDARRALLEIAENYEQLAEQAEARRKTDPAIMRRR
jgi:hypothetical protein